jgi:glycosyltransferase involved in cell wall biosynthesis
MLWFVFFSVSSIIVVDDGSKDNTVEIASMMNVKVIRNRYNVGKGAALKRGLIEACSIRKVISHIQVVDITI